ncbi:MAG: hypothetical protein NTV26_06790 [Caldiserica bacterium]|nr:hypothetical protein [Caldisericota bacterium]
MSQTVMIEALGQGVLARARALDNVFGWMKPEGIDGKRVVVLLGDTPVQLDLVERAVHSRCSWTWWSGRCIRCPGLRGSTLQRGLWQIMARTTGVR